MRPWLLALCSAIAAGAVQAADSNTTVPTKRPPDQELAQALWNQSCLPCHGAKGGGDGPLAAALGGVESLKGRISNGNMNDTIDVVRTGKGKMPAYSETIDVGDTRRILEWIRDVSSGKITPKAPSGEKAGKGPKTPLGPDAGKADVKAEQADEE